MLSENCLEKSKACETTLERGIGGMTFASVMRMTGIPTKHKGGFLRRCNR